MILTFHGTAAGTSRLSGRKTVCIEVEHKHTRIFLDAGSCPDTIPKPLDGIILSHTHPDHISALSQILMDNHLWKNPKFRIYTPSIYSGHIIEKSLLDSFCG